MSKAIRASIDNAFGFEAVCINSALVSAQNRQRLYWVGKRNPDGTYSKANVEQPKDRGILLRDILETGVHLSEAEPVACRCRGRKDEDGNGYAKHECRVDGKANTVNGSMVAEPVRIPDYGCEGKSRPVTACYAYKGCGEGSLATEAFPDNPNKQVRDYVAEPVRVGALPRPNGQPSTSQAMRIYSVDGKSVNLTSGGGGLGGKTGLYAIPTDKPIYEVRNGLITIKGKQYPIKLADGCYIIRKLTVRECMRLQTVPEWYEFPVSNTQAYKMLGNGWTVDVIAHIFKGLN